MFKEKKPNKYSLGQDKVTPGHHSGEDKSDPVTGSVNIEAIIGESAL